MSETSQKQKNNSKIVIIIMAVLIVVLIVLIAMLALRKDTPSEDNDSASADTTVSQQTLSPGVLMYDANAVGLSEDDLQKQVDEMFERAKEGTMALQFKNTAFSADGINFSCEIGNSIKNNYDMYINIYKDDSLEEQILLTGLIPPGSGIENFQSEVQLDPGRYEALLVLTQVEDDHATLHAQLSVVLNLVVEDYK